MLASRELEVTNSNLFNISQYNLKKFNFTDRVITIWNSLSNRVVSADTINTFKDRLDKFWANQDVLYDYKSDLHGIGNRSVILLLYNLYFQRYFSDIEALEACFRLLHVI